MPLVALDRVSIAYGHQLAGDAFASTVTLPDRDLQLRITVERFFLRRGLAQSRRAWVAEYGKAEGRGFAKLADPIVRNAYWPKLDEMDPFTTKINGVAIPLLRGWRDAQRLAEAM